MFLPFELRWQDIIDILLNSYILFRLYVLFRGTNAFRVFLGIMGLLLAQRIAVAAGLILTSWVVQGITTVAAIIVIVVFRNEIRAALQARNLRTFFWGSPRPFAHTPYASIAGAAFGLAEKRIGALFVLPGDIDISQKIHSSLNIDCRLTREMLMSVFWSDNPIHDGAAVIREDRIAEVAAVLPFSHRNDIPSYYGTRHRAAAGIAENSDAIAIVISEERGTVSVAHGEVFKTFTDAAGLERYLERHRPDASAEKPGRREVLTMAVAGTVSLIFITSVWFSFARRDSTLVSMEIPLEYVRRDSNFEYVDADVDTVRLQLGGAAVLLANINAAHLKARVELKSGVVGKNIFKLGPDNFSLPPGVMLRKVTPEMVTVSLDIDAVQNVPVQVDWAGTLPHGFLIESCELIPDRVQVRGPSLHVADVTTVYTEKVDVAALPSGVINDVGLVVPRSVKTINPGQVTVRFSLPQQADD